MPSPSLRSTGVHDHALAVIMSSATLNTSKFIARRPPVLCAPASALPTSIDDRNALLAGGKPPLKDRIGIVIEKRVSNSPQRLTLDSAADEGRLDDQHRR